MSFLIEGIGLMNLWRVGISYLKEQCKSILLGECEAPFGLKETC